MALMKRDAAPLLVGLGEESGAAGEEGGGRPKEEAREARRGHTRAKREEIVRVRVVAG